MGGCPSGLSRGDSGGEEPALWWASGICGKGLCWGSRWLARSPLWRKAGIEWTSLDLGAGFGEDSFPHFSRELS